MATRTHAFPLRALLWLSRITRHSTPMRLILLLSIFLGVIPAASAQTPTQQYVYTSGTAAVSGSSITSATGALNPIPGSPFNERLEGGLLAIDGQGKFLFVLNPASDDISMFQIDPATGVLSEVPGSPFAVPPDPGSTVAPSQPVSITGEASGKFVFVAYASGSFTPNGELASLAIDTSGSSPILRTQQTTELFNASPVKLLTDSKGLRLYVGLGVGPSGTQMSGPQVYSIDAVGDLAYEGIAPNAENFGFDFAIDPLNRFIFAAGGLNGPYYIASCVISPVDGTASTCPGLLYLGFTDEGSMVVENSGHFLYIPDSSNSSIVAYSIDPTTGAPTQVASFSGLVLPKGNSVADPMGPFIYSLDLLGIHVYQVNQVTGDIVEIPGSPFTSTVTCCGGIAISGSPAQAISGPAATIFPPSAAAFSTVVGTTSSTQVFQIVNVGNQTLAISSISIVGSGASSFSQTHTCLATLAANANCSVSIDFVPGSAGSFSAALQVSDNAPGSPQTLALSGTALAALPTVTVIPTELTWPAITEGTSSTPQIATVMSKGNAPLHVSSVSLTGPNPSDFSFTNNCTSPVAPGSNCTISLVFNPIAPGQRTANLVISDDSSSPASPQTIPLSGTANPAFTPSPTQNGSTSATVSAGQTAQYSLQLTPGAGYSGTVSLTCSGAPLGAFCQVPSTVMIASGAPAPFMVTVTTSGSASLPILLPHHFVPPAQIRWILPAISALLLLLLVKIHGMSEARFSVSRLAWSGAFATILLCSVIWASGCGSASTMTITPPPVQTPSGTSTIVITPAAMSSTGQPLQLSRIQLTLTVK